MTPSSGPGVGLTFGLTFGRTLKLVFFTSGIVTLVLLGLGFLAGQIGEITEGYQKNAMTAEGQMLLAVIKVQVQANETEYGVLSSDIGTQQTENPRYAAGFVEATPVLPEWPPMIRPSRHWWGSPESLQMARQACPDCLVSGESYKAIAIGNIDSDPEMDVWILRKGEKAEHLFKD